LDLRVQKVSANSFDRASDVADPVDNLRQRAAGSKAAGKKILSGLLLFLIGSSPCLRDAIATSKGRDAEPGSGARESGG
jgi:hypothetical protein